MHILIGLNVLLPATGQPGHDHPRLNPFQGSGGGRQSG